MEAYSKGGAHNPSNFATACNKCNARKNAGQPKQPRLPIKGRYGEPTHWDGLSTVFMLLAAAGTTALTEAETAWLQALRDTRGLGS